MCPVCISIVAVAVAGASLPEAAIAFLARRAERVSRRQEKHNLHPFHRRRAVAGIPGLKSETRGTLRLHPWVCLGGEVRVDKTSFTLHRGGSSR
jgi:hypothetical protein